MAGAGTSGRAEAGRVKLVRWVGEVPVVKDCVVAGVIVARPHLVLVVGQVETWRQHGVVGADKRHMIGCTAHEPATLRVFDADVLCTAWVAEGAVMHLRLPSHINRRPKQVEIRPKVAWVPVGFVQGTWLAPHPRIHVAVHYLFVANNIVKHHLCTSHTPADCSNNTPNVGLVWICCLYAYRCPGVAQHEPVTPDRDAAVYRRKEPKDPA